MSQSESNDYISFPEEYPRSKLNELYHAIPLKDGTIKTLRRYFKAMAYLYGIIPLEKAYEIVHQQCPRLLSREQFMAFAEIARHESDYFILGEDELFIDVPAVPHEKRMLIDPYIIEHSDDDYNMYANTSELQRGKPYYIPPKQELLKYSDPSYCEETPELIAFDDFLYNEVDGPILSVLRLYHDSLINIRYMTKDSFNAPNPAAYGIEMESLEQLNTFLELWKNLNNNSRMQCNRGYTPLENYAVNSNANNAPAAITLSPRTRSSLLSGEMDLNELAQSIAQMDLPSEEVRMNLLKQLFDIKMEKEFPTKKVGRNDPCPCGSEKKYKHCCGR